MTARHSYEITLSVTPTSLISHASHNAGNTAVAMRRDVLIEDDRGRMRPYDYPAVSGAALKASLREAATIYMLEQAGVPDGSMSRDALRFILKGGRLSSGGSSVDIEEMNAIRDIMPLIAIFGAMEGNMPCRAKLSVSDVTPITPELAHAGLLPLPVRVSIDEDGAEVTVHEDEAGQAEVARALGLLTVERNALLTSRTYYRHDMQSGRLTSKLEEGATAEIRALRDARAEAGRHATKQERSEANESMPHEVEGIRAGAPMVARLLLMDASEIELAMLLAALAYWRQRGAVLGGGGTKGHGTCKVRIAHATRFDAGAAQRLTLNAEGLIRADLCDLRDAAAAELLSRLNAHLAQHAGEIRRRAVEATPDEWLVLEEIVKAGMTGLEVPKPSLKLAEALAKKGLCYGETKTLYTPTAWGTLIVTGKRPEEAV